MGGDIKAGDRTEDESPVDTGGRASKRTKKRTRLPLEYTRGN